MSETMYPLAVTEKRHGRAAHSLELSDNLANISPDIAVTLAEPGPILSERQRLAGRAVPVAQPLAGSERLLTSAPQALAGLDDVRTAGERVLACEVVAK